MTKREIIEGVAACSPELSHAACAALVARVFVALAAALAGGGRVEIRRFGSFGVRERSARPGRNPRTGAALVVDARKVPFFRAAKELKTELNGRDHGEALG